MQEFAAFYEYLEKYIPHYAKFWCKNLQFSEKLVYKKQHIASKWLKHCLLSSLITDTQDDFYLIQIYQEISEFQSF